MATPFFAPFRPLLLVAAAAAFAGCAVDPNVGEGEDDLTAFSLKLTGSGTSLTATDSPKLAASAKGNLACSERLDLDGRTRLSCHRDSELVEVILADGRGIMLDWPKGRAADSRNFYACTPSGKGPNGLPAQLACKPATLHAPGGFVSPLESTVPGIAIANTHEVGASGHLLRGMAPRIAADYDDLLGAKVAAVIVFKNQTGVGHDVADELAELTKRGLATADLLHVPFKWKDLTSFKESCEQTITALQFIQAHLAANKTTYFHCTVGEDRTGYLAALHRLLTEKGFDAAAAWDGEMCERGYGAGNPLKPQSVIGTLDGSIGPLYRKLAWLVATGRLTAKLDPSVCAVDPAGMMGFESGALPVKRLTCGTSTRFKP